MTELFIANATTCNDKVHINYVQAFMLFLYVRTNARSWGERWSVGRSVGRVAFFPPALSCLGTIGERGEKEEREREKGSETMS